MSIQTLSERYPKTAFFISISLCSFFSYIDWFLLLSFSFSVSVGNCKGWLWSTYWHWLLFLSHLHGNAVFEQVTKNAVRGLWARRSKLNLVGAHINVFTGEWTQKVTFFLGLSKCVEDIVFLKLPVYKITDCYMVCLTSSSLKKAVKKRTEVFETHFNDLVNWCHRVF